MSTSNLPTLDCHAHIAPDVTAPQIRALNGAIIFAMTRTPAEANYAANREDPTILWSYGVHPGVPGAIAALTEDGIRSALKRHLVIGEIGLDRKSVLEPQTAALDLILRVCADQPVLLSLHSTGRTSHLLDALHKRPHAGAILHWFNGTRDDIERAAAMGCYFSVNAAMSDERLAWIPRDRLLPETDFPSSRRTTQARRPGDTTFLEQRLSTLTDQPETAVREMWYRNLAELADRAGILPRLPAQLQRLISRL
ncbi:TatD family hydrolase [Actinoplanes sp. NPDC026623]|uniref:TatD family hydrolase n=1 Tax=Actinoplanes sp. NPDC026623 TaxID=3155610 RepID=UPI0034098994